jgi:hypothetical protein
MITRPKEIWDMVSQDTKTTISASTYHRCYIEDLDIDIISGSFTCRRRMALNIEP